MGKPNSAYFYDKSHNNVNACFIGFGDKSEKEKQAIAFEALKKYAHKNKLSFYRLINKHFTFTIYRGFHTFKEYCRRYETTEKDLCGLKFDWYLIVMGHSIASHGLEFNDVVKVGNNLAVFDSRDENVSKAREKSRSSRKYKRRDWMRWKKKKSLII